jgi:dolichyl-phosphate beta-glucosyltransferase
MTKHTEGANMISIVVAAYNEQNRIGKSLRRIEEHLGTLELDYEIIVVDDGSADSTHEVVKVYEREIPTLRLIRYAVNRGKGYALRQGVMAATGDLILLTDADLSTPIEEFSRLLPYVSRRGYDVVIGSRALKSSEIIRKQPWWRQTMGKVFNGIVRLIALNDFSDTQCGFKIFSGNCAKVLFRDAIIDRFAFDVEILMRAQMEGYRILEAPVKWSNSPGSKVNPLSDSLRMLFDVVRIRLYLAKLRKAQSVEWVRNYNSTK